MPWVEKTIREDNVGVRFNSVGAVHMDQQSLNALLSLNPGALNDPSLCLNP